MLGPPSALAGKQGRNEPASPIGRREQVLLVDDRTLDLNDEQRCEVLPPSDDVDGASLPVNGERVLDERFPLLRLEQGHGPIDQRRMLSVEHSAQVRAAPAWSEGQRDLSAAQTARTTFTRKPPRCPRSRRDTAP